MRPATLDTTFLALADPTRRAILARLAEGEATVGELAAPFALSQPAVSKHLRVLERAGLVATRIDGPRRPRRLNREGLAAAESWLRTWREVAEANFERLDSVLAAMAEDKENCDAMDGKSGSRPSR